MYISELLNHRGIRGSRVKLQHVRGHRGHKGNVAADRLAKKGRSKPVLMDLNWDKKRRELADSFVVADDAEQAYIDFEFEPSDLLSEEEMLRIGEDGSFD